jgi:hypothetical protein
MKRREFLAAAGAAAGTALAGCLGGTTGTLATRITEQSGDIDDFESCVVTVSELRVMAGTAGAGTATESGQTAQTEIPTVEGEQAYEVANAEIDLVQLRSGNTALIDERELETGDYQYLKLLVSNVDATLGDGTGADVQTPNGAPLKFDAPFEIRENTRTVFAANFAPVKRDQRDGYVLRPVADAVGVSYGE